MKKTTKALALALCAVLLVVGTALTTIAYLQDKDSVVNTFTVGNVVITLDEAKVDEYGKEIPNTDRVTENKYKLVPGVTYTKDPQVHVAAKSEDCYVRILMTLNKQDVLDEIFDPGIELTEIFDFNENNWEYKGYTTSEDGKERTYEFRYKTVVPYSESVTDLEKLFTTFTCPTQITKEEIKDLEGFKITVVANAIQEAGFENDADAAWTAFEAQDTATTNN